jgi:hypothetical protein
MGVPVTRARGDGPHYPRGSGRKDRTRRCRRRESFEGQELHREDARFATGRNTVNPRIGSRAQHTCTVGEEQTVEVVRNHGDGSRERLAVVPRREPRRRGPRASDSSARRRWRGDLWTNPREAVRPAGRTAWIGTRRESRRQGQEGRAHTLKRVAHPGRRDLEGPATRRKAGWRRSRRGAAKPTAAESTGGNSPRGRPPMGGADGANPFAARERSPVGVCVARHTRWPLGEGSSTCREARTTLKTRRTTYPPARGLRGTPKGGASGKPGQPILAFVIRTNRVPTSAL